MEDCFSQMKKKEKYSQQEEKTSKGKELKTGLEN